MEKFVYTFDKNTITVDETGKISIQCPKDVEKTLKTNYKIDIHDQKILRHIYFNTVNGKVSFTVPNKILKK